MFETQILRETKWEELRVVRYLGTAMDTALAINIQSRKSTRVLNPEKIQIVLWEERRIF